MSKRSVSERSVSERSSASQAGRIFAPTFLCAVVSFSGCMCMIFVSVFHDGSHNVLVESWTSPTPQIVTMAVSRLGKVSSSEPSLSAIFHFNRCSACASFTDRHTGPSVSC